MPSNDIHMGYSHSLEGAERTLEKTNLQSLLCGFSIEITIKEAARIGNFSRYLPIGTEVYIVATPTTKPDDVVDLAKRLRNEGMAPVPHIAARAVPSVEALDRWLERLGTEAGVAAALIVAGGNYDKPAGPFASSMALVESGLLENHGIKDLRFAGHPEGHPVVSDAELTAALLAKHRYGQRKRLTTSLVTQFFFDFAVVAEWERRLMRRGIPMPIRVGFHGVVSLPGLIRQARYCGVGASINALARQPSKMLELAALTAPDRLTASMAKHVAQCEQTILVGCHFFPLGGFEATANWASSIARGNFELCDNGAILLDGCDG